MPIGNETLSDINLKGISTNETLATASHPDDGCCLFGSKPDAKFGDKDQGQFTLTEAKGRQFKQLIVFDHE